ncbi:actin-5 [Leptinotarsa decemlineata]|uniref:actin-5 n=1 Tax=Leptinotarsa decemlineata TaxID=7539 RepID=UPI000C251F91|nr:actin, clone 302-like [Leptinotarsa decemlineata]
MCALVFDCGSGTIKAGFSGNDAPHVVIPTIIGYSGHEELGANMGQKISYIGNEAQSRRGELVIKHPIEHGIIMNLDDMEEIWYHIYYNKLRITPKKYPVLLTEAQLNPKSTRAKMTQVMFESFNIPAMYLLNQAVLSLYASGRMTGIVLDSGHGVSQIVPITEGYVIPNAHFSSNLAGGNLTEYLTKILSDRGYNFNAMDQKEIVQKLKENICYVPIDFDREMDKSTGDITFERKYKLPDGQIIAVDNERFRCPEALFQPSLLGSTEKGIHQNIYDTIMKCGVSIHRNLYANIVLSGGNSMFLGIENRMTKEIMTLAPCGTKINIVTPSDRNYPAWTGGSIFASLSNFKKMCVTKQDYEECGPSIVNRKCF